MRINPQEKDLLLLHQFGFLAQKRLARGLRLNYPETIALLASQIVELVRDSNHTVSELMDIGRQLLGFNQVLPGVPELVDEIHVEATFPDGTKLVSIHEPICQEDGDLTLALYGSFLPLPSLEVFSKLTSTPKMKKADPEIEAILSSMPGAVFPANADPIEINAGRKTMDLVVESQCDRPIQVGSHFHFLETNKFLVFDREKAYGMRLNIASGTAVRFEPGEQKTVQLVEIGGERIVHGGNELWDGPLLLMCPEVSHQLMARVQERGFGHKPASQMTTPLPALVKWNLMDRKSYINIYGPTTGDKIRLGDTTLVVEIERDLTVYGEECKFGGGKTLRDGMGQMSHGTSSVVLDTLITNAIIIDAKLGIIKADIGIKDKRIVGVGKGGNPDTMDGVDLICGAGTEVIAAEHDIVTAGAIDSHIHFICPQLITTALAGGTTSLIGGGTGPAAGTNATTCSPGPNHIRDMIQSTDHFPLNFGFTGKGNSSMAEGLGPALVEQIEAGAMGLKLHEDWGSTPAAIDHCLRVAEEYDIQVMIHTDTLNEAGCVEQTLEAIGGRCIHTYHSEGAGGGHAPDILRVCGQPNILPSSTNPTRPYTRNTIDEHLDMLLVCHHLDKNIKEDIAFAESRIRAETIAAEDILHDMGAISMMSSDSQAMGRVGEVVSRTWHTADKMRRQRGRLPEEKGDNDNYRVRRYIAKYTFNPAVAQGIDEHIGSIEKGKLADLVIWRPRFFGIRPETVIKGGQIIWNRMGLANASIPTPQPILQRKMFGYYGKGPTQNSLLFVSKHSLSNVATYGISKQAVAVKNCRHLRKKDMLLNNALPNLRIDPQSYQVWAQDEETKEDWQLLTCSPAYSLPLTQLFAFF